MREVPLYLAVEDSTVAFVFLELLFHDCRDSPGYGCESCRGTSPIRNSALFGCGCVSYRGTSLIRNSAPLGPYSRTWPRALGGVATSVRRIARSLSSFSSFCSTIAGTPPAANCVRTSSTISLRRVACREKLLFDCLRCTIWEYSCPGLPPQPAACAPDPPSPSAELPAKETVI